MISPTSGPDWVIKLNPNGPFEGQFISPGLLTANPETMAMPMPDIQMTQWDRAGWIPIRSDAYEFADGVVEHPRDGYERGSQLANPLEIALFCTPAKGFVANSVARSFATAEGGAVFYSGGGRATGEFARAFAANTGRKTIEMTPGGKVLDSITNFSLGGRSINNSLPALSDRIWGFGSRHFAEGASGQAYGYPKVTFPNEFHFFQDRTTNIAAEAKRLPSTV